MKTLVAVPCMRTVETEFFKSCVVMDYGREVTYAVTESSLIYDARNYLAVQAVKKQFDRVLWLDSDMVFEPDLFKRLSARLDEGYEFVSGMYFQRVKPIKPNIYKEARYERDEEGRNKPVLVKYDDYPRDSIFEIAAAGFGGCMMTVGLLVDVARHFGLPFSPLPSFGEDISFCMRAGELGHKLYCDSSIKLGHVGHKVYTEEDYYKGDCCEKESQSIETT